MHQQALAGAEPAPFDVPAHSSVCVVVDSDLTAISSNGTFVFSDASTTESGTQSFTAAIDVGELPPCSQFDIPDYPHSEYACQPTT